MGSAAPSAALGFPLLIIQSSWNGLGIKQESGGLLSFISRDPEYKGMEVE